MSDQQPRLFVLWLDASDDSVATYDGVQWPDGTADVRNRHWTPPGVQWSPESLARAIHGKQARIEWAPEFPLPIRADGSHAYTSTYCVHGDHAACRLRCKTCHADCLCDCSHPTALSCRWPACLPEKQQRLLAAQVDAGMRGEPTAPMPDQRIVCECVDRGINIDPLPSPRNTGSPS